MNLQKAYEVEVDLTSITPEERAAGVEYLRGSAVPRYVERLDDVEWVTERRHPETVKRTLALVAIVIGGMMVVIGLILGMDDRPPADLFPTRIPTPAVSPHAAVPDSGVRPPAVKVVLPR